MKYEIFFCNIEDDNSGQRIDNFIQFLRGLISASSNGKTGITISSAIKDGKRNLVINDSKNCIVLKKETNRPEKTIYCVSPPKKVFKKGFIGKFIKNENPPFEEFLLFCSVDSFSTKGKKISSEADGIYCFPYPEQPEDKTLPPPPREMSPKEEEEGDSHKKTMQFFRSPRKTQPSLSSLITAVKENKPETVITLLTSNPTLKEHLNEPDEKGKTVMDHALESKHTDNSNLIFILLNNGARPKQEKSKQTLLGFITDVSEMLTTALKTSQPSPTSPRLGSI